MKKIIATVLAMVMALALCTTAFAADLTIDGVGYNAVQPGTDLTLEKVYTKDVTPADGQYYIQTGSKTVRVATDAEVAVIKAGGFSKNTLAKMTDAGYLFDVYQAEDGKYYAQAAVVDAYDKANNTNKANMATKDGTSAKIFYFGKELGSAVAYYQFATNDTLKTAEATTVLYKTSETFGANKAPVYTNLAGTATYALVSDTDWTGKDKDAVGKLSKIFYNTSDDVAKKALNAAGKDVNSKAPTASYYYVLTETTTPSTGTTTKPSPKTFDAGIAMYVGMALTSVAGSAVVIGKKKEF